jgi:hypothetical protein
MLAAIWTDADWAEILFLIGFILFAIAAVVKLMKASTIVPFIELGLAAVALGLLAL